MKLGNQQNNEINKEKNDLIDKNYKLENKIKENAIEINNLKIKNNKKDDIMKYNN